MRTEEKRSKAEVDYGPGMRQAHCGICEHFRRVDQRCELVSGVIYAADWCKLFERRGGDRESK